jgi:hypothetical protein
MREATIEEATKVWQEINLWYATNAGRWNDVKSAALSAAAEFLANSRGFTLFSSEVRDKK